MYPVLNVALGMLLTAAAARASPYWIDWEGDDWPENQGWTRVWGNWDGQYQGDGANRTLEDGILTYDSLYDLGVCDFSQMERPGQMDPGPGELFVMEWRLKVDEVVAFADPGVGVCSDEAWAFGLSYAYDRMYSHYEGWVPIEFSPGVFHAYRLESADMRAYDLFVDGQLVRHGAFVHLVAPSEIAWGDAWQGAASLHEWDYFRFGAVVPEPAALLGLLIPLCCGRSLSRLARKKRGRESLADRGFRPAHPTGACTGIHGPSTASGCVGRGEEVWGVKGGTRWFEC